ncbi:MAG: hypothetical protein NXH95_20550 [Pseudomonadaceae bacterium]|nr:hypothetical protein [Pseudomonadaceae bacterium]
METFDYSDSPYPIRSDIRKAHQEYWQRLRKPGSWWNGAQRVAIAAESRQAFHCAYCVERKQALSPYQVAGQHETTQSVLDPIAVDAIHRIITDQTRITARYIEQNDAAGLSKNAYVELTGIVVAMFSIDEFHRALGLPLEPLPAFETGEPSQYQPEILSDDIGFVPTVPPEGAVGAEADLWSDGRTANVVRALTLVPDALRDWRMLSDAQYISFASMANFVGDPNRSINRMQTELIAGRVSAINECFY